MVILFLFFDLRVHGKSSCFTLGVEGVFAGRFILRPQSPQPFAIVRECSREGPMAVPAGNVGNVVSVGGFTCGVMSFRLASVALRDIPTWFIPRQNSLHLTKAMLLHRFQKIGCIFCGKCDTLETSIVFLRLVLSGQHQVLTPCKLHSRRGQS